MKKNIGIQGIKGSFHHIVAENYFGNEINIIEFLSFDDMVNSLSTGSIEFAVMAIENSTAGSIIPNYALIDEFKAFIVGEYYLYIKHNLVALYGQKLDDINEVQKKEKEWRDFIENRLMIEHADYFSNYDLPLDLFEFFELTKSDVVIYAHLKSIFSIHRTRRDRVKSFEQDLLNIMDKLSN